MAGHAPSGSARGQSAPARDLFVPINFVRPQWVRDLAGDTTEVSEEDCFHMHTDADLNEDEGTVMSLHSQDLYIPSAPAPIVEPELLQPERISAEIHSVRELVEHHQGSVQNRRYKIEWENGKCKTLYDYDVSSIDGGLDPTALFEAIEASRDKWLTSNVVGQILTVPMKHITEHQYQDGSSVVEDEVTLYHSSRVGLLYSICRFGLAPSGHSHGITGPWCFAICSRDTFSWGSSVLEKFEGMVLTIKAPRYLLHRQSANTPVTEENIGRGLVSNGAIRAKGNAGFLRWVIAGTRKNAAIPVRKNDALSDSNASSRLL